MDDEDGYLLSAHLGPGILYVVDVRSNALIRAISGVPGITGVEYVAGLQQGIYIRLGRGENRAKRRKVAA